MIAHTSGKYHAYFMCAVQCNVVRASQRACLPHSRIMLHQPSGGAKGQVSDILIHAQEVSKIRDLVNDILVEHTQQDKSVIGNHLPI